MTSHIFAQATHVALPQPVIKNTTLCKHSERSYNENVVAKMFAVVSRSLTIMLVAVSSYSIVTTFPRFIAISMNYMTDDRLTVYTYYFYKWAVQIIAPWNYCGNFFFYVLSGKQFRQELAMLFCCRKRSSGAFVLNAVYLLINCKKTGVL